MNFYTKELISLQILFLPKKTSFVFVFIRGWLLKSAWLCIFVPVHQSMSSTGNGPPTLLSPLFLGDINSLGFLTWKEFDVEIYRLFHWYFLFIFLYSEINAEGENPECKVDRRDD